MIAVKDDHLLISVGKLGLKMRVISMNYTFLLVGEIMETRWPLVLEQALSTLGKLKVVSEDRTHHELSQNNYNVIIIDAGAVQDAASLVARVRDIQPASRIIVATASPTWQRAREMLKAGASDYIRKSQNEQKLRTDILAVLEGLSPSA
jgi:DNA-binding NarL/FixJ family response regulator